MSKRDPRFSGMLEEVWNTTRRSHSVLGFSEKLRTVASNLQRWGRANFGLVKTELCQLHDRLEQLRAIPMCIGPTDEDKEVEARIVELCYREEVMW